MGGAVVESLLASRPTRTYRCVDTKDCKVDGCVRTAGRTGLFTTPDPQN